MGVFFMEMNASLPPPYIPASHKAASTASELIESLLEQVPTLEDSDRNIRQKIEQILTLLHQTQNASNKRHIVKLIKCVDKEIIQSCRDNGGKIHRTLKRVENILKGSSVEKIKSDTQKTNIQIAFIGDIDCPDHNGAMHNIVATAFMDKVPFITTKSILLGLGNSKLGKMRNSTLSWDFSKELLMKESPPWRIYEQAHTQYGSEFVIFLPPTSFSSEDNDQQILQSFDFVIDGSIKRIPIEEAFSFPQQHPQIEGFISLFNQDPQHPKIFFLAGHGGVGKPAALAGENYKKMLSFLSTQKCNGLALQSCFSGGKSSLLHLKNNKQEFDELTENCSFPVIIHSIGDFPTNGFSPSLQKLSEFLNAFTLTLESRKAVTSNSMKQAIQAIEKNELKSEVNYIQMYLPTTGDSPGGFRPLIEKDDCFSLSYQAIQKAHLGTRNPQEEEDPLTPTILTNRNVVAIHPVVCQVALLLESEKPILISMIPGDSCHFIQEINLESQKISSFLSGNENFNRINKLDVCKVFFLKKLTDSIEELEDVVIKFNKDEMSYIFKKNEGYYLNSENTPLTALEYGLLLNEWRSDAHSSNQAIKTQTGGQQSNATLNEILRRSSFIDKETEDFIMKIQKNKIRFTEFLQYWAQTSQDEKGRLIGFLLKNNREILVKELVDKDFLSPTFRINGAPLFIYALRHHHNQLFVLLHEKMGNANLSSPSKVTLLHEAVQSDNKEIVNRLLNLSDIDVNCKTVEGITPVLCSIHNEDLEIFHLLRKRGADINAISAEGISVINAACMNSRIEIVKKLLKYGANPNIGDPPPLMNAIIGANPELIELLLDYGANPYQESFKKNDDNIDYPLPIQEAMFRCHPDLVQRMFEHEGFGSLSSGQKSSLLATAISLKNAHYVETLKKD